MIQNIVNSIFSSVCYRLKNVVIDPGDEWEGFDNVKSVLLTHAHFDHIYGLNKLIERNPDAVVYTNEAGLIMLGDAKKNMSLYHETPFVFDYPERIFTVTDGDEIDLDDDLAAKVVFTPGHNPSCITWIIGDAIFTGDALIPGVKTVTNLPHGNKAQALASEALIKSLALNKSIYPGHKVFDLI